MNICRQGLVAGCLVHGTSSVLGVKACVMLGVPGEVGHSQCGEINTCWGNKGQGWFVVVVGQCCCHRHIAIALMVDLGILQMP